MSRRWRISKPLRRGRFFRVPIVSTQFVSPPGIASAGAFGVPLVNDGVIRPRGIPPPRGRLALRPLASLRPSSALFPSGSLLLAAGTASIGVPTITTGPVTVSPVGMFTSEAFGVPFITVTYDLARLVRVTRRATGYELLAVARVPQASGPPTFITVDPINWKGLSWVDELSKPQQLNASCPVSTLTDSVIQRLRHLRELPTELWLYRNGQLVFAGPWTGWLIQNETLTMTAPGLLGYLRYMYATTDLVFSQVDQLVMVKTMINHWQDQPYGNFGLDTSHITASSGVLRDGIYKKIELHNIGQRIEELGQRINGFDIDVDPTTREVRLWFPTQGTDRSSGESAVVFDSLTVTSTNVSCSSAPGDVASDAYGSATGTGDALYSTYEDPQVLATFGKAGVTGTFDSVSVQATLDDHVQGLQVARKDALLIPGPGVRTVPDADLSAYGVGDTVAYQLHARLGIDGSFRLRKRTVTVTDTGVETSALEFV